MPDANPEIATWSQGVLAAGVFLGGLVYSVFKLIKSADKKEDNDPYSKADNAKMIALAKEIAELKAQRAEDSLRKEFDVKLQDIRQDFAEVMRAGREGFYKKLDDISSEVSELKGMLNARLPGRQR